jgi:prevent-host-death family protein
MDATIARRDWREVLDAALAGAETVIERNGKPTAVVIPWVDYEALLDELDDVRAGRRAAEVYAAWKADPSLGKPLDQVEAELREQGLLDG